MQIILDFFNNNNTFKELFLFCCYTTLFILIYFLVKNSFIKKIKTSLGNRTDSFNYHLIKNKMYSRVLALILLAVHNNVVNTNIKNEQIFSFIELSKSLTMIIFISLLIFSFLNSLTDISISRNLNNKLPIKPISQLLKVLVSIVTVIYCYSLFINESPSKVLAGLGAISAILLIVFKDSIQSFVSAVQISLYDTIKKGDWITIPNLNVDGDVEDINLNIITIKNFDNTRTIIPTYSLMNNSFKNYRKMLTSGRRIKRTINIDINTISFLSKTDFEDVKKFEILGDYLKEKEMYAYEEFLDVNSRNITNIGTFRKYVNFYLQNNENICKNNTLMVRQLESKGEGLPLEIYCFTKDTSWVANEEIMSDIFDHLYSILPNFKLKSYQKISSIELK